MESINIFDVRHHGYLNCVLQSTLAPLRDEKFYSTRHRSISGRESSHRDCRDCREMAWYGMTRTGAITETSDTRKANRDSSRKPCCYQLHL